MKYLACKKGCDFMMKLDIQKFANTDGSIVIGTEVDTDGIDEFLDSLPQKVRKQIDKAQSEYEELEPVIEKLSERYGELMSEYMELTKPGKGELIYESDIKKARELRKEIIAVVEQLEKATGEKIIVPGIKDMDTGIKNVGKGLQDILKKVVKWSLLLFGVTQIFTFIKNAISKIASDDPQLKADLDYIKNALIYTLEPVVRGIVNLMKQLIIYIGYIVKMWTGKNIFENANKSLKGANKQAQQLQKTLAPFDEMDILQDNQTNGNGAVMPSFDLTNLDNVAVPGWVEFIGKYGQEICAVLLAIGTAIELLKLSKFAKDLGIIKNTLKATTALGIGIAIAGIALLIQDIISFIKDPSWDGFIKILRDITIIIIGIAVAFGAWPVAVIAGLALIVIEIVKHWDEIKEILGKVGTWIFDHIIKPVGDFFVGLWDKMVDGASYAWEGIKKIFSHVADFFGDIFSKAWKKVKDVFSTGGKIFTGIKLLLIKKK